MDKLYKKEFRVLYDMVEAEHSVIFNRVSVYFQLADQAENIDILCKLILIGTQAVKRKI